MSANSIVSTDITRRSVRVSCINSCQQMTAYAEHAEAATAHPAHIKTGANDHKLVTNEPQTSKTFAYLADCMKQTIATAQTIKTAINVLGICKTLHIITKRNNKQRGESDDARGISNDPIGWASIDDIDVCDPKCVHPFDVVKPTACFAA